MQILKRYILNKWIEDCGSPNSTKVLAQPELLVWAGKNYGFSIKYDKLSNFHICLDDSVLHLISNRNILSFISNCNILSLSCFILLADFLGFFFF